MILRNPTQAPRVVPFGVARTSRDKLPNGRPAFRVTQRFADTDRFFGGQHGAIDLGNYNCGDVMLATHAGRVSNRRDIYGALITEIKASTGEVTGYGHLRAFWKANGSWAVARERIGTVGDTGLGAICHCHLYHRDRNGRLVDPWPRLEQNQTGLTMVGYVRFNAGVNGVNVRNAPDSRKANIYAVAWADPRGVRRVSDNALLFAISSRRGQYGSVVRGPDGIDYFRIKIGTAYRYVATRFMHRV